MSFIRSADHTGIPLTRAETTRNAAKRQRTFRRALVGVGLAIAAAIGVRTVLPALENLNRLGETETPAATDVYTGQTLKIHIADVSLENGTSDRWPHLRLSPMVPADGYNSNILDWGDVATIDGVSVNAQDGTYILVASPKYLLDTSADDSTPGAPLEPWIALDIKDTGGNDEEAYLSLSAEDEGFVTLDGSGDSTPIGEVTGPINVVTVNNPSNG